MKMKHWLGAAVSCLLLALWTMPVTALPITGARTSLKVATEGNSIVEPTHWQRRYAYYYGGYYADHFERYYPYDEPIYDYYYRYPTYHDYHVYGRYPYYRHHHHHHHHRHHYRDYRRW